MDALYVVFEQYQKARIQFVQNVAEMASRPQNIETLHNSGKSDHANIVMYYATLQCDTIFSQE